MEDRQRAAELLRRVMSEKGYSANRVAALADIPDGATVREFADGLRWPRPRTRNKIERALNLAPGTFDAVARGEAPVSDGSAEGDRVVAAIEASDLTRANKHRLIGTYYDMLDGQAERGTA